MLTWSGNRTTNPQFVHPADELGKDTSQSHVLDQEQVQLVGTELGHAVAGSGSCRLQDADCALPAAQLDLGVLLAHGLNP